MQDDEVPHTAGQVKLSVLVITDLVRCTSSWLDLKHQ